MRKFSVILSIVFVFAGGCSGGELSRTAAVTAGLPGVFSVKDYGAAGDGEALDNAAINEAIKQCTASGGGTVYFPAGTYLSGSIRLKSNVTLHLSVGATILGASNDIGAYDPPEDNPFDMYQDFGHSHWRNSLIWGEGLENIAITGLGTIDGGGMTAGRYGGKGSEPDPGGGDKTIALKLCKNILIRDITIRHAGHFAVLATGCDNMTIDNVKIDTQRDGINLDCCRNVRVSNCSINSPHDDALCPKSSYGLGFKRATENVTITNCVVSGYKEGTMLDGTFIGGEGTGRIKFGTESNGGFKNIVIDNCVFDRCRGIALEIVDGGIMENISISNITMRDVANPPIFIRLGNRARGPNEPPVGKIRNINISNILATGVDATSGVLILGIPGHPVEDVRLSNIKIIYKGGGTKEDAKIVPPELEDGYPEPSKFGRIPAYGFYCRHVKGLELHNVEVGFEAEDLRPALICDDVEDLELDNFKAERAAGNESLIVLKNVRNLKIRD